MHWRLYYIVKGLFLTFFSKFWKLSKNCSCLDEEDIQLLSKQFTSLFKFSEKPQINYSSKDFSDVFYTKGDQEGPLQVEYDANSKKTKIISTCFAVNFCVLRFGENPFFNILLCSTACWDFKPGNAIHVDSSGVYICEKIYNLNY